jgi:hypothetical protein
MKSGQLIIEKRERPPVSQQLKTRVLNNKKNKVDLRTARLLQEKKKIKEKEGKKRRKAKRVKEGRFA